MGPLLLAAQQWVIGAVLTAVGLVVVLALARALHQLARRWVVFVPAGVVVHDPLGLVDPVLLPRGWVQGFAPAPADTDATDLTMGAPGLAVEIGARAEDRDGPTARSVGNPSAGDDRGAGHADPARVSRRAIASDRRVGRALPIRGDRSPSP